MTKITFYGAAQEVTGSCHLIEDNATQMLVDCGIFQGTKYAEERNHEPFPFAPDKVEAAFATHAHMDHIGRLPKLVKDGYRGPIYTTAGTRDLAEILFEDAVEIMDEDEQRGGPPKLYRPEDIPVVLERFVTVEYHTDIPLPNGWTARFLDAGHILGSGILEFVRGEEHIIFSGDLGNPPVPILNKTEHPHSASMLVMESTYGNRVHEDQKTRETKLEQAIISTIERGGVLMIPSFALERTQELLYYINKLYKSHKLPDVPVFVDSPLAIHATEIFEKHREEWSPQARKEFSESDFFNFPGLRMTATRDESRTINGVPGAKIIIAGSGMMNGGRIAHHAMRYLPDTKSTLLFIGYQANGTLGRALLNGAKRVRIHGQMVSVRAHIEAIGAFSAHADEPHLLSWVKSFEHAPRQIAIVHGELDEMQGLAKEIQRELNITPVLPKRGQTVQITE